MPRFSTAMKAGATGLVTACLLLVATPTAHATDWPMFQVGPTHTGFTGDAGPDEFNVRWKIDTEDDINGQPAVVGDRIYFVNKSGVLYCAHVSDGSTVWAMSGHGAYNNACPAVVNGRVYIGKGPNSSGIVCRSADDGSLRWEETRFGEVPGAVTVADGKAFYGTYDSWVVCLDAASGDLVWWHDADGQIDGGVAVDADARRVYVGTGNGDLICLPMDASGEVHKSSRHWVFDAASSISGIPALHQDEDDGTMRIFFGTWMSGGHGHVYHIRDDGSSASQVWEKLTSDAVQASVAVGESWVWATSLDGVVYSWFRDSGDDQFCYQTESTAHISSPVTATYTTELRAYATSYDNYTKGLYCLNAEAQLDPCDNGDPLLWKDTTERYQEGPPCIVDDALYVGDHSVLLAVGSSSGTASTQAAFSIGRDDGLGEDTIRVVFDRPVNGSGLVLGNYAMAPYGTIVGADFGGDDSTAVHLVVTGAPSSGEIASLTITNVEALDTGFPMPSETCSFWMGSYSVSDLQAPDSVALTLCEDRSVFAGPTGGLLGDPVTFRGICTANVGGWSYLGDHLGASERAGIRVGVPGSPLTVGDQYLVAGRAQESSGETAVSSIYYIRDEGTVTAPDPVVLNFAVVADRTCDENESITNGEDFEGMVARLIEQAMVVDSTRGGSFRVAGGPAYGDTILVDMDPVDIGFQANPGSLVEISGVIREYSGMTSITPLSSQYIVSRPTERAPSNVHFAVFPNPARSPRLSFVLPKRSLVDVAVFDVAGRRLRTLAHGTLEAGLHDQLVWDGTDASGAVVGPGLFFYRLRVEGETYVARGVRLD